MGRRAIGVYILVLSVFVLMMACSDPKEALVAYLEASIKGNHMSAYHFISSEDKSYKKVREYIADASAKRNNLIRALSSQVSYQIKGVEKKGDQASVRVEISAPDYQRIINELFAGDPGKVDQQSVQSIKNLVEQNYRGKKLPMVTTEWNYTLIKEEEGWRVYLGWETEARIKEWLALAEVLESQRDLAGALGKLEEALKLDPENPRVKARIEELKQKIAKYEEAQAYLANILISEVRVMPTVGGGSGIFLKMKNQGDKTLKMIELTVEYLDHSGNVAGQQVFYPVKFSGKKTEKEEPPLAPGEVRDYGLVAKQAPGEWSKKVNVRVTDVQFME